MLPAKPHFIGIGAIKAATSWLYNILNTHPEVWMPPIKELHFFDRKEESSHLHQILFRSEDYLLSRNRWRSSDKLPTLWNLRYFCGKRNISNYKKLFSPQDYQICGEITPSYATCSKSTIVQVKRFLPELKIIYILRNPIERDWSQLCMTVKNAYGEDVNNLSDQEIIAKYENKFYRQSSYVDNLGNWTSIYNKDQIFIGFYDQLKEDPISFLNSLFVFLEIPNLSFSFDSALLARKTNSYSQRMNQNVRHFLIQKEYKNIVSLNQEFNNTYTTNWLSEANRFKEIYG